MSDLISRTALLEVLKYNREEHTDENGETRQLIAIDIDKMIEYVEKMPTAYNVEAVVDQLGKASYEADCLGATVKYLNFDDTVHIVRAGGKE